MLGWSWWVGGVELVELEAEVELCRFAGRVALL
jgi:hypothetical protein